ncbi:sarcosine oxidase subunit gamma [Rhizobium ruizarguesonis]|uniref:sarcosine oxidase subunit gamma n=1 Tax=Rhizobium ruizarguesonis TaxID=2081791 RepID=UPI00036A7B4B|nr:sarcosine oxidase subunit gamma family protein [Rhizobium ruizarguesonis]MBY5851997.1 sarcosine oxidase subunit gamma [Rhizobium leguminosarum]MBY5871707.1 sarcosine oxidase subunit gamma [Rhizobium leguminosarum]NEH75254.1 sarcosine oxidase subunit gamma [Rhizobium ruizarguesonis]NEI20971.1 sarcosine oxidase subunit gamma [Rhizobium ruizarguesonis]NEI76281.1 sarcosine oxidase subunit gamma [Rhizobium ruizarguesonis]
MRDLPQHKPVLAGTAYNSISEAGIRLEALPEGHLLHVLGAIEPTALAAELVKAGFAKSSIRKAGFRQWFVAGDEPLVSASLDALVAALAGKAFVMDQSHGRVRIGVSGRSSRALLSRGTAVDLDPSVFPDGHSAMTMVGHLSVQIARIGNDSFELTVLRSFGESLWEDLAHMAASAEKDSV